MPHSSALAPIPSSGVRAGAPAHRHAGRARRAICVPARMVLVALVSHASPMDNTTTNALSPGRSAATTRLPVNIAFVTLLIALVARQVFALWEHYDGSTDFDELRSFGTAYWPMNLFVFGPAFAIGFFAQGVLIWRLARERGRILTVLGASLVIVGGTLFALVGTAHALPYAWAADPGILEESLGRAVVDAFTRGGTAMLVPYIVGTQAVIALGALASSLGGWLSGTVPVWYLITTIVVVIAFFALPTAPGDLGDALLSFVQLVLWGVLGWFGWRRRP